MHDAPLMQSHDDQGSSDRWQECRVCAGRVEPFAETTVLGTRNAHFDRCCDCGSILAREPDWLDQAYERAIADNDIGLVGRNVRIARQLSRLLRVQFDADATFLDHGAGTGMLVRMMRDAGFDFAYADRYAENLFAPGHEFDGTSRDRFSAVVAIELLEHLVDPVDHLRELSRLSDTIIATTIVLPDPVPRPQEWWYYSLESGQHVTLYTPAGLDRLARRLDMELTSIGDLHVFSRQPIRQAARLVARGHVLTDALTPLLRRPSLLAADYERLTGRPLG